MEHAIKSGSRPALWVYNPWLDLIVGCGAWSAPLLLLTYFTADSSMLTWAVAFYGLALFFNFPHYMATIYRAYHTQADFEKYRIFTVHITALIALTLLLSHFWFKALPWIFTLYLTWSPWHYSGQNYGLFTMFTRRAGAAPTAFEGRALRTAFLLSYLVLFVNFHTGASHDPLFISLGIPERTADIIVPCLGIAFLTCSTFGLQGIAKQVGWRRLAPALTLFSTQCLWFLLPTALSVFESFQIPQSRYSAGVLAIMHSAQYLWITSFYAKREAQNAKSKWRPLAYFSILLVGGVALFIPGPWVASRVFHYDFAASFLLFTALINIHHFILDGAIWKLRDSSVSSLLLNSQTRLAGAGSAALGGARWLIGRSAGARALRISAACLLLGLALVDQTRYYLALHGDNLQDLQTAALLNGYDSALQSHIASQEMELGDSEGAIAAWKQAVNANPGDQNKRDLLLKALTQRNRFQEAFSVASLCLKHAPRDTGLLLNHGILALRLGDSDTALHSWKRALAVDPLLAYAKLYVAQELHRENHPDLAIMYYVAYLDQITKAQPSARPPASSVASVVLQLADCQSRIGRVSDAEHSLILAQTLAAEDAKLESFATVTLATLKLDQGYDADALPLFQKALTIDEGLDDSTAAIDWYNYAMYLKREGYSPRLIYASLVKAGSLIKRVNGDGGRAAQIDAARDRESLQLSRQDERLRNNPRPAIEEALAVTAK